MPLSLRTLAEKTTHARHRLTPGGRRKLALERVDKMVQRRPTDYLTDARMGVVDNDGIAVHYYEVGPSEADVTVVFVHGFTLSAECYFQQVEALRECFPQVKILLVDYRGHGATGQVPLEKATVSGAASDVLAVISAHAPRGHLVLVGHSLGGLVVLNMLRHAAPGIAKRIASLVLASSAIDSFASNGATRLLNLEASEQVIAAIENDPKAAQRFRARIAKFLGPGIGATVFKRPYQQELVDLHAAMILRTPIASIVGFFDDLQKHNERAAKPYLADKTGYVLVGEQDLFAPPAASEKIVESWPNAWYQRIPDAGHMLPLETPDHLTTAIVRLVRDLVEES